MSKTAFDGARRTAVLKTVTWVGVGVNVGLSALKLAAGWFGGSRAVVADGVHSLSDLATDAAILFGVRYWSRPADATHPHGHQRLETMVTFSIGLVLSAAAAGLLWDALRTLQEHKAEPPGWIAFWAAVASIFSKEILYRWTVRWGRRIRSMSVVANGRHHRSDALSSIPVALAVAGAVVVPSWSFLDHVGAVVVSLFIFRAAYQVVRPAFDELIDRGASPEEVRAIRDVALDTAGVHSVHGVRTRYVGGVGLAVDLHVLVKADMTVREGHAISEKVKHRLLEEGPDVIDVVAHLEPHDDGYEP